MSKPYKAITGNPRRKTKTSTDGTEQSSETSSRERPSTEDKGASKSQSSGRKRRITITPQDPAALEAIAEDLGLPYAKVYNMAFKALLEKLGRV